MSIASKTNLHNALRLERSNELQHCACHVPSLSTKRKRTMLRAKSSGDTEKPDPGFGLKAVWIVSPPLTDDVVLWCVLLTVLLCESFIHHTSRELCAGSRELWEGDWPGQGEAEDIRKTTEKGIIKIVSSCNHILINECSVRRHKKIFYGVQQLT